MGWRGLILTKVRAVKSHEKYWAFLSIAGVSYVCRLLRAMPSCSARALKRA